MRPTAGRRLTRFLAAGAVMFVLCGSPQPGEAAGPALAVWLGGGQGESYPLAEIEQVTFGSDTLKVVASGGTDNYSLESVTRIGFLLDDWTGIDDPEGAADVVKILHLFQNQPNPFSPETRIAYELPQAGRAELRIYAVNGRLVRTLVEAELEAGPHTVVWDGLDESGRAVSSGVYFYVLATPGVEESRKMLLLR